jgi:hypothetical protein
MVNAAATVVKETARCSNPPPRRSIVALGVGLAEIRPKFARGFSARLPRSRARRQYRSVCAEQVDITLTL